MKNNLIGISGKIGSGKDTVGKVLQWIVTSKTGFGNGTYSNKECVEWLNGKYPGDTTIQEISGYKIKKYADKLKDIVCLLIGCTREQLEDREFKEKPIGPEWMKWFTEDGLPPKNNNAGVGEVLTPRKLLQLLGTDCGRDIIHPDIWVNALFADYRGKDLLRTKDKGIFDGCINKELQLSNNVKLVKPISNWIITDVRFPNEAKAIKDRGGIVIRVDRNSWKPKSGDTIKIKVFSNWSVVTYTHTDDEGNHYGVGTDGYKYKSSLIKEHKEEHPSETALDDYEFDYVIDNNGSIEELVEKVKQLKLV